MNKITFILLGIIFCCGCTHKPAPPHSNIGHQPIAQNRSSNSYSNNGKPPLPSQKSKTNPQVSQPVHTKSSTTTGVLAPSDIFERFSSAVFKIHTSTGCQGYQGSGFFISSNGVAVSNYHVFQGTTVGYEDIILSDGRTYKVTQVYHKSEDDDFIIFKVGIAGAVNYINIASSTPKIGEKIYTIGSPRGLDNTFSSGEISQIRDNGNILQISAPIDHGSSGGVRYCFKKCVSIKFKKRTSHVWPVPRSL